MKAMDYEKSLYFHCLSTADSLGRSNKSMLVYLLRAASNLRLLEIEAYGRVADVQPLVVWTPFVPLQVSHIHYNADGSARSSDWSRSSTG